MGFINFTSAAGVLCHFDSSTIATGAAFTVEAQSSTNQVILRNIYIQKGSSSDIYVVHTTTAAQSTPLFSGQTESLNSFMFMLIGSSQLLRLVNNSNANIQWFGDGVVVRV